MSTAEDPLAVGRAELLSMIEKLERLITGLRDVREESESELGQLRRLREQLLESRTPERQRVVWTVARKIIGDLAVELIKRLTDSSNYKLAAAFSRRISYDPWRVHQIPSRCGWTAAA
jgi:hypothetical protein